LRVTLTPVYSTAIPVRGLSGLLRRAAYKVPDYKARRWLLLIVADRIDALEHRPGALTKALAGVGLVTLAVFAARRLKA
jgi:hypothetical protein